MRDGGEDGSGDGPGTQHARTAEEPRSRRSFYVRTFADRYPDQTAGLVLLDPAHERQFDRLPDDAVAEFEQADRVFRWAARLARLGVFRIGNPQAQATVDLPVTAEEQIVRVSAAAR